MEKPATISLADKAAEIGLRLVAAANVLFILAFLLAVFAASGKARAEMPVCTGKDLTVEMAANDPAAFAAIRAKADAMANGKGRLWKIEKEGVPVSYLFGTMHVTDPRVVRLTPEAQSAFDGASTVVIETTDVLDQKKMLAVFAEHPEVMMLTDGTTLDKLMTPEELEVVKAGLGKRGIPFGAVSRMQP